MPPFEPLPTERAGLIARIKNVAFTPTRFRRDYDERHVDDFLDAVIASLAGSSVPFTPPQIRERELRQVGFKGGYDIEQVDDFRALIAEAVQLLH
ncbi:MAG TPA: DivIVA domain-containing protein [Acidothermaceae bacterium]|jgi:DivIVA domain-containing protein